MKIEKEKISLKPYKIIEQDQGALIQPSGSLSSFTLSKLQFSYLEVFKNNNVSIEELVQFYLGQGWLVSFRELFSLIQFLCTEKLISNSSIIEYFKKYNSSESPIIFSSLESMTGTKVTPQAQELPFFRNLDPQLAKHLLQNTEKFQVPPNIRLIHAGTPSRDMFILLKGSASIYKEKSPHREQLIATLGEGTIFGERGFLLNQPRSADIITNTSCEVLRIRHLPEFDQLIKSDKAKSLQHRFWVLQALLSSPIFRDLPTDSLDSLIFTGKLYQTKKNQILFQEGQTGTSCFILVQGQVAVFQNNKVINNLQQGACFGEISLLMSGGIRTATTVSHGDSVLLEIQQKEFYKTLSQNIILANDIETLAYQRISQDQKRRNSAA